MSAGDTTPPKDADLWVICASDAIGPGSARAFGAGEFFTPDRALLKCGRHGATFEIATGLCVEGPCQGKSLEPITLTVSNGEVLLSGVALVEDDGSPDPFQELDDTMELMIHPD